MRAWQAAIAVCSRCTCGATMATMATLRPWGHWVRNAARSGGGVCMRAADGRAGAARLAHSCEDLHQDECIEIGAEGC